MKSILILSIIFSIFIQINGLKILGLLPICSKSHFAVGYEIIKTLAEAGREKSKLSQ